MTISAKSCEYGRYIILACFHAGMTMLRTKVLQQCCLTVMNNEIMVFLHKMKGLFKNHASFTTCLYTCIYILIQSY